MMKRVRLLIAVTLLLVAATLIGVRVFTQPKPVLFHDSSTGVTLSYPASAIAAQPISEEDKMDKIIFRASEKDGQEKAFLITLRYEDGLHTPAQLAKIQPIELVLNSANKALPQRFPNYEQLSVKRFTQADKPAAEIVFEYKGPSNETIQQRLLILMDSDDRAFYLSAQAKKSNYEDLQSDFDQIFRTLSFEQ